MIAAGVWQATKSPSEPPRQTPVIASAAPALTAVAPKTPEADPIPTVSVDDLPTVAPSAAQKPAPSAEVSKESDMALLGRAQGALASNPAQALALLSEHAKSFPRSGFSQEREVLTIDALVRLGRRGEAEARADQFAKAYPKSGHNRRIDALLGRQGH